MTDLEFVTHHRRILHQHPEISMQEFRTTTHIIEFLEQMEIHFERPLETGAVAYLKGNSNRTIAYRADIDALPIHEENDVPYRSTVHGAMHACGHDGHTTALMLFAKRCKALADQGQLPHNIIFIFQPSEETAAGADQLIKAWQPENDIEAVFGVHMMPNENEGKVVIRDDEITASATEFRFHINGRSAHVAAKHEGVSSIETLLHIASQLTQMQHFHLNGLNRNIIHIGNLNAGEAINTVASHGYLEGTIRTYEMDDLDTIKTRMQTLARTAGELFGSTVEVTFNEGYPPVMNAQVLRQSVDAALSKLKLEAVENDKPYLFGEDFSFYSRLAPSYFVFFGSRNEEKGFTGSLHTSTFDLDEKVLVDVADYFEALMNEI